MQHNGEDTSPQMGWAQVMQEYFVEGTHVYNHAKNGRSSKSFLEEGLFEPVYEALRPHDFLFIQFGHNDQKEDFRKTEPFGSYQTYLSTMVLLAIKRGAYPILLTSVTRRDYNEDELNPHTHGLYPRAMRELASKLDVPCIDVFTASQHEVTKLGKEKSMILYMHIRPNNYAFYPEGVIDNTHLRLAGCHMVASIVSKGLNQLGEPYSTLIKKEDH